MEVDKSKLKDVMGRQLTQSLFLEIGYKVEHAVFTLDDNDKEYKGKVYPSLKRLYLETDDPTEWVFANKYLLGWQHWKRLNENKILLPHFNQWREELEIKLRCGAIAAILDQSASEQGGFQAAKWIADRGWDKRVAGRPSKAEKEREDRIIDRISEELTGDIIRMENFKK